MRKVNRLVAAAALCALSALGLGAAAQQQELTPSEALSCMTPAAGERGTPKYPEVSFERKEGGRIVAELTFSSADRAPRMAILYGDDQRELAAAVRDHVSRYRVPCLGAEQTARIRQEFSFVPTDGRKVRWLAPVDADDERRLRLLRCVKHQRPDSKPDYPMRAERDEVQGTVVLRLSFDAPAKPPTIDIVDNAQSDFLADAAIEFARGLRMPCYEGARVRATQYYVFRIAGMGRTVLKDMPLVTLLRSVKDIKQANVYFDFNAMGCPFEVRFRLYQPHSLNSVGEVGEVHPERLFFLDWLRRQQLDLPPRTHNAVLGQISTVSVPCTVLNLGATSGGGASQ